MVWSLENTPTTIEIWENVFQYLNLREQLHAAQACGLFHNIIKTYTWKIKCKQLKLYPIDANVVLVTNRVDNIERYNAYSDPMYELSYNDYKITDVANKSSVLLNYDEVQKLMGMNLSNVEKLQLIEEASKSENKINIFSFLTQRQFVQLTTLHLSAIQRLGAENLNIIKLSCPQLKALILSHCLGNAEQGVLQDHKGISSIASMKSLKTFSVTENHFNYGLKHIMSVVRKLQHVEQFVLKVNIIANNSDDISEMTTFNLKENLFELISVNLDMVHKFPVFTKTLHAYFENLAVLAVTAVNRPLYISRNFLENLTKSCKHLKILYLYFCEIEDFVLVPSLETLTLEICSNISWKNLKSILNQHHLQSLTSVFNRFSDDFVNFYIESPLEYLRIETFEYDFREEFKQLLHSNCEQMKELKTLIFHDYTLWYEDGPIAMHLPLKGTFYNLQLLFIDLSVIALDDIMEMKCLKQLAFIQNENAIDLSNLLTILKKPTLEHFSIYTRNSECWLKVPINELLDYKTNLRLVRIPLNMFNRTRNIWLNFLSTNPKLQLACYFTDCDDINCAYLKELIENDIFPARIKSIQICDLTIDCSDIKESPDAVRDTIDAARKYCNQFKETVILKL